VSGFDARPSLGNAQSGQPHEAGSSHQPRVLGRQL